MIDPKQFSIISRNISRHVTLTKEEGEILRSALISKKIRRRQYLLQAGDVCRSEAYVLSGCLRSYIVDNEGDEHVLQFAVEDWWISDLASLITGEPANRNIDALEDSEVLLFDRRVHDQLHERIPKLDRLFRLLLQNAYVAHERRIYGIIGQTAEERYRDFVARYPQLIQRIPQKHIASYLGVTPEFLSRVRADLAGKPRQRD